MNATLENATDDESISREAERLEELARDLRAIAQGTAPTNAELRRAPQLDGWALSVRPARCLTGVVTGHPILRGPIVRTSELYLIDRRRGWARTLSRFYRLGTPLAAASPSLN